MQLPARTAEGTINPSDKARIGMAEDQIARKILQTKLLKDCLNLIGNLDRTAVTAANRDFAGIEVDIGPRKFRNLPCAHSSKSRDDRDSIRGLIGKLLQNAQNPLYVVFRKRWRLTHLNSFLWPATGEPDR
jgi:hypothetical protein